MGRVKDVQLFTLFRNFLTIYLPVQRNVSENTVVDYRISLNQLLEYISNQRHISYMSVTFEMINKETVNAFLDHLTEEKKFSPATRNNRLAAIKSFLSYASGVHPEYISLMGEISTIKVQRGGCGHNPGLLSNPIGGLYVFERRTQTSNRFIA